MIRADLVLTGIGELATLAAGPIPRTGASMQELSVRHGAALAVRAGRIAWIGRERRLSTEVRLRRGGVRFDVRGGVVLPGWVDAHTHVLFAGERASELPLKIRGASYAEIARQGGGIYSSMRATRRASDARLIRESLGRLERMRATGTTTAEVKTGYALTHAGELRLLRLIPRLARAAGLELVPTYLGAHAVPPGRASDDYVAEIIHRTLPEVRKSGLARFCDVFCEPGFFTVAQSARILRAAIRLGLGAKIHADEFVATGGARLAAHLGARSAEHLLATRVRDYPALRESHVTAVLLPATPFASLSPRRSPGRALVDAGVAVALGSDCSPNTWIDSMPTVLAHAVYSARLSPREAITAGTVNAAQAIDAADRAGIVAVGRPADLAVYPVPSLESICYRFGSLPSAVFRQGIRVPPSRVRPQV